MEKPRTGSAADSAFALATEPHDHDACVDDAMARAEAICGAQGARLTPMRRRVLELVWNGHRPRGAYDILEDLASDGKKPAPLTVYRALDFLVEQGLVHRLESLNAFVGCADSGGQRDPRLPPKHLISEPLYLAAHEDPRNLLLLPRCRRLSAG